MSAGHIPACYILDCRSFVCEEKACWEWVMSVRGPGWLSRAGSTFLPPAGDWGRPTLCTSEGAECRVAARRSPSCWSVLLRELLYFLFKESTFWPLIFPFFPHNFSPLKAYVGSEVMYDETAVASSPPPYTAYAAPTPEVGSRSSLYRIHLRETWGLCATILLKLKEKKKTERKLWEIREIRNVLETLFFFKLFSILNRLSVVVFCFHKTTALYNLHVHIFKMDPKMNHGINNMILMICLYLIFLLEYSL